MKKAAFLTIALILVAVNGCGKDGALHHQNHVARDLSKYGNSTSNAYKAPVTDGNANKAFIKTVNPETVFSNIELMMYVFRNGNRSSQDISSMVLPMGITTQQFNAISAVVGKAYLEIDKVSPMTFGMPPGGTAYRPDFALNIQTQMATEIQHLLGPKASEAVALWIINTYPNLWRR